MSKMYPEFPGTSQPKKKRNPQHRDYMAVLLKAQGLSLGSGITNERGRYTVKRAEELRSQGHKQEGDMLAAAMDVSIRGAYEIAKLTDEALFALCNMVTEGEARNLLEARRFINEMVKRGVFDGIEASEPITVSRCKDNMYRISSLHNHSSVLVSAKDMLYLGELIDYLMPEIKEKVGEDPGSSEE